MERTPSLTIEGHPLLIRKSFKEIPYYNNIFFTIERNPLPYYRKRKPYYGRKTFPYYRRKSLTNKEHIQGNPLL